eukprot:Skav226807  [mRNA]  locus=scaffold2056:134273:145141:- [translate_table: standard]
MTNPEFQGWSAPGWDSWFWTALDAVFGVFGWLIFGKSWTQVRNGFSIMIRLTALLVVCVAAHYLLALCWPVVSLVVGCIVTLVWLLRTMVKCCGRTMFLVRRLSGGAPEAETAEFFGPDTGEVPETGQLRKLKKGSDAERWVVLRRDGQTVVFKVQDSTSIKSSGLYLGIEPDTMRGDPDLIRVLQGHDKVHICRNSSCSEDGQHFRQYAVVKALDAERFHLTTAANEAQQAGSRLFSLFQASASKVAKKAKDFTSESEPEVTACCAHTIRWSEDGGDRVLSDRPCTDCGTVDTMLLAEDVRLEHPTVTLCPKHATKYHSDRFQLKCVMLGCTKLGQLQSSGLRLCPQHAEPGQLAPAARRSRSRSRPRDGDRDDAAEGLRRRARTVLPEDDAVSAEHLIAAVKGEDDDEDMLAEEAKQKRRRSVLSSPGRTPRSGVQRSLARMGLVNSPDKRESLTLLEEFMEQLAEAKDLGLDEEEVRHQLAASYALSVSDFTKKLFEQATEEQRKGTKGLTKFLAKWRRQVAAADSPEKPSSDHWSMVSTPLTTPTPTASTPTTTEKSRLVSLPPPGIYNPNERKAGTGEGETGTVAEIARAIQHQTTELANLVKVQNESAGPPNGTMKSLGKTSEELVYLLRACGQYTVEVCPGEHGANLASALLAAQAGASSKLRAAGFRQKVTQRLAIGLSGPFWGTQDKYALSAADFLPSTDAELDQYAVESRTGKTSTDVRPSPPTRFEDWNGRAKRQNAIWALVYGREWAPVRDHALQTLSDWHLGAPHKWPLQVVQDVWEELHWRFGEELKGELRKLKALAGRESMPLSDLKFYALMPDAEGKPPLSLPRTFDLHHPEGWFMQEVLPRIERRQERLLWRLTWEGGPKPRGANAGGQDALRAGAGEEERPTLKTLFGPKLTPEETNRAKERAPVNKENKLLCWGFLSHSGCTQQNCQRAHENLKGTFEALDPAVQMQLLRRGGLRRMKLETKDSAAEKIKALRTLVAKDKQSKIKDGQERRRAGKDDGATKSGDAGDPRAGGVTWAPPPVMTDIDYTKAEQTLESLVRGPQPDVFADTPTEHRPHPGRHGTSAPEDVKKMLKDAQQLADGPVLKPLSSASDDLYAWAATRVACEPNLTLKELMEEMVQYGMGDLAAEAAEILEASCQDGRAGDRRQCTIGDTKWDGDGPGRALVDIDSHSWHLYDFKEDVFMTEELAGLLGVVTPENEKRQCVAKTIAAGLLHLQTGSIPSMEAVASKAQDLRLEQARLAAEAEVIMGAAEPKVSAVEAELRMYCHDVLHAGHDKDFRALAVFPVQELSNVRLAILRLDYKGDVLPELILGTHWRSGQPTLWALIHRGHMTLLVPTDPSVGEKLLRSKDVYGTPSLGFGHFWHQRHDQPRTAPGVVACRHCRAPKKAGEVSVVDTLIRKNTCLPALAALAAGARLDPYVVKPAAGAAGPSGLVLKEFFAGHGVITQGWLSAGEVALEPVELYTDPHRTQGPRAAHDLSSQPVQHEALLHAQRLGFNVLWIACPCTTFCDWNLQNSGTRTFANPEGTPTAKEANGNCLSNFGAKLFETALEAGAFPIAESSGLSGRYPKQWHLPAWKRLLQRPDVDFVELDMCAFGLAPLDSHDPAEFYRHRTGLAFPRHAGVRSLLARLCPGLGASHRHVPLQGNRPGSDVTRCTEAGVSSPAFVRAVVEALQQFVTVGGRGGDSGPQKPLSSKAGGQRGARHVAVPPPSSSSSSASSMSSDDQDDASEEEDDQLAGIWADPGPPQDDPPGDDPPDAGDDEAAQGRPDCSGSITSVENTLTDESTPASGDRAGDEGDQGHRAGEGDAEPDDAVETDDGLRQASSEDAEASEETFVRMDMNALDDADLQEYNHALVDAEAVEDADTLENVNAAEYAAVLNEANLVADEDVLTDAAALDDEDAFEDDDAFAGCEFPDDAEALDEGEATAELYVPADDATPVDDGALEDVAVSADENAKDECDALEDDDASEDDEAFDGRAAFDGIQLHARCGEIADDVMPDENDAPAEVEPVVDEDVFQNDWAPGVSTWNSFENEGLSTEVKDAAFAYIDTIEQLADAEVSSWRRACASGDRCLSVAGTVERAAVALWIARELRGMNNLSGVDDEVFDGLLHPDHLAYLRDVRAKGMAARFEGERHRQGTRPHPRARASMPQVYAQLFKDLAKHRILLTRSDHPNLQHTISSPFEAVPKMLPNRTISSEVRLVHDQRGVNGGTHKTLHPPAWQPGHAQIVRRILFLKARYPNIPVVLAKKDVAGAFRLLWLDPKDVEIFGGDVPWIPRDMGSGGASEKGDPEGLTMLYLVSSFGFSGSPGEWTAWGRATEEIHRGHGPAEPRRDGAQCFDGKILVDDMVLVEAKLGLRPWVSSEVYEWTVKSLLGEKAVNAAKDAEEGMFQDEQTVWGLVMNAKEEKVSLPEARIAKGAYLLAEAGFDYGERSLTLKELQRFRGIATGWSVVVNGLKNELKAADRFLGGIDGQAPIVPRVSDGTGKDVQEAWEELWSLFDDCRFLCARSHTWSEKFGGDMRELLPAMERLSLPGALHRDAVFVSSDATLDVLGAIDWTAGVACRERLADLRPWVCRALVEEGLQENDKMAIHIGEMLSFVAFACQRGPSWNGRVVIYAGDNKVVYHWITSRRSNVRAGRLLIRVLNLVEMRYRCQVLAGWWRTYHNEDADAITRLNDEEAEEFIRGKGWTMVDVKPAIKQALEDTERFGLCFLSWADQEDRMEQMRLHERRMFRSIFKQPKLVEEAMVVEWTNKLRLVKDFEFFHGGDQCTLRVVATTLGPDPRGKVVDRFWDFLDQEVCDAVVVEGPRDVAWDVLVTKAERAGWKCNVVEFLTTELGEVLARRRKAVFLHQAEVSPEEVEGLLVRTVVPPSIGTILRKAEKQQFVPYVRFETAIGQGNHPMLPMVGAHVWFEEDDRKHVYRAHGPGRWPLVAAGAERMEEVYILDKNAPPGTVRRVTGKELWMAQGRQETEYDDLVERITEHEVTKEGCAATGRRTALSLLAVAIELCHRGQGDKAGRCRDPEDEWSMGQLLLWLRKWRKGEFGRAVPHRKAGGVSDPVWLWGEDLWVEAMDLLEMDCDGRAGGRKRDPIVAEAQKFVQLQPECVGDLDVQAQVEEWLEEHMTGDQAPSTQKAYQGAWRKWQAWCKRQGWLTPYLDPKGDMVLNENRLLGYIGYMGWLGTSPAMLKQIVFAVKDAHKRAGHGDALGKMHRLWIVLTSLDRHAPRKPRRLGVTVGMLKWIGAHLQSGTESFGELKVDCVMLTAAISTAWFFMLRAKEFTDSSGVDLNMIVKGEDLQFCRDGQLVDEDATEVTLQFKKTKNDQLGFGTCRTMTRTGSEFVCVVSALEQMRSLLPQRFKGNERHLPLFRWAAGGVLKRVEVQAILQKAAKATGLPAERFQSHSLRIGGASALYQATGEIEVVKRAGRWTSGAVHRYLHEGGDVLKGLGRKMAEVDQWVHYT